MSGVQAGYRFIQRLAGCPPVVIWIIQMGSGALLSLECTLHIDVFFAFRAVSQDDHMVIGNL